MNPAVTGFEAVSVSLSSVDELFLPDLFAVDQGFHGRASAAHFTLMASVIVIGLKPRVEILLQLFDAFVDLLAKRHLIEFLEHGFVETLADTVRLG